ncbi:MAG: amidase family protein [Rhizomicrobium sp.]
MSDILSLDATAQLAALTARRISSRELLAAALARTDRLNPAINAVVARDPDRAFADARRIDDIRAARGALGPLAGLPMTVKDTLDVEGLPASAGMASLLGRTACDAAVVAAIRAAGAIVWGKTNTPVKAADWQTYNPLYGTTNNPFDPARTPGGSSGGSAAALAAGFTALEIGADIGGSLRIPASFCGVFAHKPSFGLVSQRGLVPPPDRAADIDLAVVGPLARSARDLSLLMSVIAPFQPAPPATVKGLRVALWLEAPGFVLDVPEKNAVAAFARKLEAAGAIVEPVAAPVDAERLMATYTMLLFSILGADLPAPVRALYEMARPVALIARRGGADAMSWAQALLGHTARRAEWAAADRARDNLGARMAQFFQRHDVLLAPVAPVAAFPHDHSPFLRRTLALADGRRVGYREMMRWVALATLCGLPATAMPVGLSPQGLPIGVQLIGPRNGDARLLAVAQAVETACGGFIPPPADRSSR